MMLNYFQESSEFLFYYNLITGCLYFLLLTVALAKKTYSKVSLIGIVLAYSTVLVISNNYVFNELGHSYFALTAVDSLLYDKLARAMVKLNLLQKINYLSYGYSIGDYGFPIYLSYVYTIIKSPLLENALNILINIFTVVCLFKIGNFFLQKKYAFLGSLIYGTSQYVIFFMSTGLKEPLMILFIILSIYFYLQYVKKNNLICLFISILFALILVFFRLPLMVFLIVAFGLSELTRNKFSFKKIFLVIVLFACSIAMYIFFKDALLRYVYKSGSRVVVHATSTQSKHFAYVVGFISGLFGPFPTYLPLNGKENLSFYAASLTLKVFLSLPFLYASYYAIKLKNKYMKPLVLFSFFEIIGLIINANTFNFRVSLPHMGFVILLAMYTLSNRKKYIKGGHKYLYLTYYVSFAGFLFMWNFLRL